MDRHRKRLPPAKAEPKVMRVRWKRRTGPPKAPAVSCPTATSPAYLTITEDRPDTDAAPAKADPRPKTRRLKMTSNRTVQLMAAARGGIAVAPAVAKAPWPVAQGSAAVSGATFKKDASCR